ncbi:MAG: ABC transporter ATP-binding protein [Treponemataceae bacterium]
MSRIALIDITKQFGDLKAVSNMNLEIAEGEFVALLGGSGCGKTTTLRMIAGFTELTAGDITIDGKSVKNIPAHKRNIGVVFQNYALFPHLTAFENIAFGLTLKKMPKKEISERVGKTMRMVKLDGLEARLPRELSGGQQQRVALARALVMEPRVLLLDEPLSNLDAKLRQEMQVEIKRIQKEVGITTILVTHDQEEAISLADRIAIMNDGLVQQVDTPKDIFKRPRSRFVADFMGFSNFIDGTVREATGVAYRVEAVNPGTVTGAAEALSLDVSAQGTEKPYAVGDAVTLAIRPENVAIGFACGNCVRAKIASITYKGTVTRVAAETDYGFSLRADVEDATVIESGGPAELYLPPDKIIVLPR